MQPIHPCKQCPVCRQTSSLHVETCPECGHTFRTKFGPTADPATTNTAPGQTQQFSSPPASASADPMRTVAWAAPQAAAMPAPVVYSGAPFSVDLRCRQCGNSDTQKLGAVVTRGHWGSDTSSFSVGGGHISGGPDFTTSSVTMASSRSGNDLARMLAPPDRPRSAGADCLSFGCGAPLLFFGAIALLGFFGSLFDPAPRSATDVSGVWLAVTFAMIGVGGYLIWNGNRLLAQSKAQLEWELLTLAGAVPEVGDALLLRPVPHGVQPAVRGVRAGRRPSSSSELGASTMANWPRFLALIGLLACSIPTRAAGHACDGSPNCDVCTDCSRCRHCHILGGTCGVNSGHHRTKHGKNHIAQLRLRKPRKTKR
jgi:hypothetical protein